MLFALKIIELQLDLSKWMRFKANIEQKMAQKCKNCLLKIFKTWKNKYWYLRLHIYMHMANLLKERKEYFTQWGRKWLNQHLGADNTVNVFF